MVVGDGVRGERAAAREGDLVGGAQVDDRGEPASAQLACILFGDDGQVVGADREAVAEGAAGDGGTAEVAQVDGRGEGDVERGGHVSRFRMRALPWSISVTSTMMQMMMALRCP